MHVTVRLFARLREIVGAADMTLKLDEGATVRDAWKSLVTGHPQLGPYERSVSCAVNEDYARPDAQLRDGDEVAFLPPVSGGAPAD